MRVSICSLASSQKKNPRRQWWIIWGTTSTTTDPSTTFGLHLNYSANPWIVQNWLIERVVDDLPVLGAIEACHKCPRIYSPVCGDNKRTYTNLCYMKCGKKKINVVHYGMCYDFIRPGLASHL